MDVRLTPLGVTLPLDTDEFDYRSSARATDVRPHRRLTEHSRRFGNPAAEGTVRPLGVTFATFTDYLLLDCADASSCVVKRLEGLNAASIPQIHAKRILQVVELPRCQLGNNLLGISTPTAASRDA